MNADLEDHRVEVLLGEEAKAVTEDERYPAIAFCSCGWWVPAVHGQEAEELSAAHKAVQGL